MESFWFINSNLISSKVSFKAVKTKNPKSRSPYFKRKSLGHYHEIVSDYSSSISPRSLHSKSFFFSREVILQPRPQKDIAEKKAKNRTMKRKQETRNGLAKNEPHFKTRKVIKTLEDKAEYESAYEVRKWGQKLHFIGKSRPLWSAAASIWAFRG